MRKQKEKITTIIFALALVVVLILALAIWHNTPVTISILSTTASTETPETSNPTSIPTIEIGETQTPSITPEPIVTASPTGEGKVLHSGSYKKTKWKIYESGLLEVKGTGNMYPKVKLCKGDEGEPQIKPSTGPGWYNFMDEIKSADMEVKGATDVSYLFFRSKIESVDLSKFDTSKVTNMESMFEYCDYLHQVDLNNLNTSNVTNMSGMFRGCSSLTKLDVSKLDTSKVTDMSDMFDGCSSLITLDVSKLDTSKVTDMSWMFYGCSSLKKLDMSKLDTSNVTDMSSMFEECRRLKSIDMSNLDVSGLVRDMDNMFSGCNRLKQIVTPQRAAGEGAIFLPDGVWKDSKGNTYTYIWHNVTESITLTRE